MDDASATAVVVAGKGKELRMTKQFSTSYDVVLIIVVLWLAFHVECFAGGFGWFLLLGLSPRAWST